MSIGPRFAVALLVLVMAAFPAAADVLVMKDGSRVETQGTFEVDGRKVTFTSASGVFSVLRASEVDFEATETANAPPPPEPQEPTQPEAPVKPVLVLTHATIGQADPDVISPRITMYKTDWCPTCHKAERFLNQEGVPFTAIDVEKVPGAAEKKKAVDPDCGVPVIVFGKNSMCGLNTRQARKWIAELKSDRDGYETLGEPLAGEERAPDP